MKLQKKPRPAWAGWRYERGLTIRRTADLLEETAGYRICSHEKVRTLSLPFGDPERTEPDEALAAAIEKLTDGEITPRSFSEPISHAAA